MQGFVFHPDWRTTEGQLWCNQARELAYLKLARDGHESFALDCAISACLNQLQSAAGLQGMKGFAGKVKFIHLVLNEALSLSKSADPLAIRRRSRTMLLVDSGLIDTIASTADTPATQAENAEMHS